ncbi:MAG: triose-phosphate isomerase [Kiloniellales bacterium]
MSRERLIAGNWKMNGLLADGLALANAVVERVADAGRLPCELLLCPPATLLADVGRVLAGSPVALGGQDCHLADHGAHTGDISAAMLADAGCRYVIVGHSERRADHGESDDLVAAKAKAAYRAGLTAIVCVGETAAERDAGRAAAVVAAQLAGSLPAEATASNTVIAYEPVWAIGSGRTPSLDQVRDMHAHIRGRLKEARGEADSAAMRILYGGSVTPKNAAGLLAVDEVDGALVGGASLVAEDFWAIAQSCP